jgi:hypothetical protein
MPTRKQFYFPAGVSLCVGVIQLLLAWRGLLFWDAVWVTPTSHVALPWFGYIANFQWWVPYVTSVPVMMGCSTYGLSSIWQMSGASKKSRLAVVVAIVATTAVAVAMVTHEILRSLTIAPDVWAQWNDMLSAPSNRPWLPQYRSALHFVGYAHYLVAYALSVSCVVAALALAVTYHAPQSLPLRAAARRRLLDVIACVKVIILGYLLFLVLLRSSKVGMWLKAHHQPIELTRIYEFVKDAKPYFEVAREGILVDLLLGLLWCGIVVLICVLLGPIVVTREVPSDSVLDGVPARISTAYAVIGKPWLGIFGLFLLGIVLPPPSGWHLIAVCGTLLGGYLVARGFRTAEAPAG